MDIQFTDVFRKESLHSCSSKAIDPKDCGGWKPEVCPPQKLICRQVEGVTTRHSWDQQALFLLEQMLKWEPQRDHS